jgi:hypothetical protein
MLADKGKIFLEIPVFKNNFSKFFILKLLEKIKEIHLQPNDELNLADL